MLLNRFVLTMTARRRERQLGVHIGVLRKPAQAEPSSSPDKRLGALFNLCGGNESGKNRQGLRPRLRRRIVARMRVSKIPSLLISLAIAAAAAFWLADLAHNDFGIPRHTIRADALLSALLVLGLLAIGLFSHRLGDRG